MKELQAGRYCVDGRCWGATASAACGDRRLSVCCVLCVMCFCMCAFFALLVLAVPWPPPSLKTLITLLSFIASLTYILPFFHFHSRPSSPTFSIPAKESRNLTLSRDLLVFSFLSSIWSSICPSFKRLLVAGNSSQICSSSSLVAFRVISLAHLCCFFVVWSCRGFLSFCLIILKRELCGVKFSRGRSSCCRRRQVLNLAVSSSLSCFVILYSCP